jgi:hypothetical protein
MFKFVVSNENLYLKLLRLPLGKYFFLLNIKKFQAIRNPCARESFLSQFILPNKTLKSTSSNRFEDLNEMTFKYIDPAEKNIVHDIAVSDGMASLELYNGLSTISDDPEYNAVDKPGVIAFDRMEPGAYDNLEFYISDKYSKFYISNGCITSIYSADYTLMHYYLFNFLYADNKISNWFFLSKICFFLLKILPARSVASPGQMTEITLFNREVIDALNSGKIRELKYDVLDTRTDRKFTFIRAMNILNRVYFSEEQILQAIDNISYSLSDGGILLAGRTSKDVIHATFYRKTSTKLMILETINNGSDTDDLVNRLNEPEIKK